MNWGIFCKKIHCWEKLTSSSRTRVLHYSASHFHDYEWCHCIFQWQYIEKWSPFSNSSLMHCFTPLRHFISQRNTLHWLPYLVLVDWIQVNCHFYYFTQIFFLLLSNFSTKIRSEYVQNDNVEKDISRALRQPIKYQMTRTIICESGVTTSWR